MMAYKVLDLFSGAGGLSRGFYDAGYDVVLGVDFDEAGNAVPPMLGQVVAEALIPYLKDGE